MQPNAFNPLLGNPAGAATATAHVKVLNPLTSLGPGMHAQLVEASDTGLVLRVLSPVLLGAAVQIRTSGQIAFGEVRAVVMVGTGYEIEVVVKHP